jgi:hypothetical protein
MDFSWQTAETILGDRRSTAEAGKTNRIVLTMVDEAQRPDALEIALRSQVLLKGRL